MPAIDGLMPTQTSTDPPPWRVTGAFDPEPGLLPAADDTLVDRIKWTTLARVALISCVLAFAIAMDLGLGPQRAAQVPETLLYQWAATAYTLSFVVLLATHLGRARAKLVHRIAFVSVTVDAVMALSLVHMTDGLQSLFQFALPLAVLNSAVVLARAGAIVAASLLAVGTAAMAAAEVGWVALPAWRVAYLASLAPRQPLHGFEVATDLLVQIAAAYATALLSSHLMLELDRARGRAMLQRRELATLRVRYDDVVNSLPDGLLTINPLGVVTSANPAALAILRCRADELVSFALRSAVPELADALQSPPGEWEITRATGEAPGFSPQRTQETARIFDDGSRQILACRVAPLRDQDGMWGRVVVLRDVTAAHERDVQHKTRERLAAIGAMATAVAHEIRNPLASISGAVQMLESADHADQTERSLYQIVQRETSQLSDWIGEFLDFARPRQLQLGPCDLLSIASETVLACQQDPRVAAAGIKFGQEAALGNSSSDFLLLADAVLLRQVVWNLLRNACQAVLETDDRRVAVHVTAEGAELVLSVEDSGPGVPADQAPRIFEPFHTTKGEGTGMGLALVARNVASHKGRVNLLPARALGGARFEVRLPRRPVAEGFGETGRPLTPRKA